MKYVALGANPVTSVQIPLHCLGTSQSQRERERERSEYNIHINKGKKESETTTKMSKKAQTTYENEVADIMSYMIIGKLRKEKR